MKLKVDELLSFAGGISQNQVDLVFLFVRKVFVVRVAQEVGCQSL